MLLRAPISITRRSASTAALSRLELDINAAHNKDQLIREPAEAVTKSVQAISGESLRGDVQLPKELQDAVDMAIAEADDNSTLRINALSLYAHLRATAPILPPPASFRDRQALTTTYDAPTSLAYLAGLMPSVYAATVHVLNMTKSRLEVPLDGGSEEVWRPDRVVDYGSGTASAAWALKQVWGSTTKTGKPLEYVGLEWSKSMVELSSKIIGMLPKEGMRMFGEEVPGIEPTRLEAKVYQLSFPAMDTALAKLQLSPRSYYPQSNGQGKRTLAISAFSLSDQGTKERRKDLVRTMWESGAEVIVIIDRGTPGGSKMVGEAREQLLSYGRRSVSNGVIEGELGVEKGCFVLAPCPHDGACPLIHSTKQWCHFSQRVRSPPFLRHTKHSAQGEDDAIFSYVVIKRGSRPGELPVAAELLEEAEDIEELAASMSIQTGELDTANELSWARIIAPPRKRSGHVLLDVCASSGVLEQHTIPKSQGRQEYYDARKAAWGDSFPHPPKNGPKAMERWTEEQQKLEEKLDKFKKGGARLHSKKAERTGRDLRRRKDGGEEMGDGGIRDFELEIGPDGQLKIVN